MCRCLRNRDFDYGAITTKVWLAYWEHHERLFLHTCDERCNDIILKEKTTRVDTHALNGNYSWFDPSDPSRLTETSVVIETFIVMFAISVVGVSLFWIFGDGKLRQQQLANILIYLWMFIIGSLLIGFIDWIIV